MKLLDAEAPFPPPPHEQFCVLCFASPLKQTLTPFYVSNPQNIKFWPHFLFCFTIEKGFTKNENKKRGFFCFVSTIENSLRLFSIRAKSKS